MTRNGTFMSWKCSAGPAWAMTSRSPSFSKRWSSRVSTFQACAHRLPGKIWPVRSDSHTSAMCSTLATVGSVATTDPFRAPAEVPITTSGVIPRSNRARSIPTWLTHWLPPPESTNATCGRAEEEVVMVSFVGLVPILVGPSGAARDRTFFQRSGGRPRFPLRALFGLVARFVWRENARCIVRPQWSALAGGPARDEVLPAVSRGRRPRSDRRPSWSARCSASGGSCDPTNPHRREVHHLRGRLRPDRRVSASRTSATTSTRCCS